MFIDLDPNELKKVSINIEGYDDALNNDYFPNALQYVSNLVANSDGIKTEEVANLLRSIYDKLIFYSDSIKSNLNGLEEQIAESLEAYNISTEDAREKLAQLFLVMQEFVSSGKIDMSLVSSDGYMTEDTGEELTSNDTTAQEQADLNLDSDFKKYLEEKGEWQDYLDELNSPTTPRNTDHFVNEYINQFDGVLNDETKPLLKEFYDDLAHYGDSEAPGINSRFDNLDAFLASEDGQKWAKYMPSEDYVRDFSEILSNPEAALTDYLYMRGVENSPKGYFLSSDYNSYISELQGDVRSKINYELSDSYKTS